jgi:hypothetical protein
VLELNHSVDADRGPVGSDQTCQGTAHTPSLPLPHARSSRASDGDDDQEIDDDEQYEPTAEDLFWERVDDAYQRWKEEGGR